MKNILWAWVIENSVCVICWTVLAIVFNKWWIALFAMLFISSLKTNSQKYYYRICDKCGEHNKYAYTYDEALKKAKEDGWVHYEDGNKDYCPDCQEIE